MDDNKQSSALDQLAANLGNLEMTDSEGKISEDDTSVEDTATQETNTFDDTAEAEKPEEPEETSPQDVESDSETDLAEDEKGKRYIPEKRFKKTYAEKKKLERELADLKAKSTQQPAVLPDYQISPETKSSPTDDVETEMLFMKYPQFNPDSEDYSSALDKIGLQVFKANPGISRLKAAALAIKQARELTNDQVKIVSEARAVKAQQSDQGITSRVLNRSTDSSVPGEGAGPEELEAYLRKTGQW